MKALIYILIFNHLLIGNVWASAHMAEADESGHAAVHVHVHADHGGESVADPAQDSDAAPVEHDEGSHVHLSFQAASPVQSQAYPGHADQMGFELLPYLTRNTSPPVPPPNA